MGITIVGPDGRPDAVDDGYGWDTPYQLNDQGLSTGLERNSRPFGFFAGIAGAGLQQRLYRDQIWVKVCVDKLVDLVLRLPLKVYERDSQNNKKRVTSGPLVNAIRSPDPDERKSAADLKQWLIKPVLIFGTSATRIRRDRNGTPIGFGKLQWPYLDPRTLDSQSNTGRIDFWRYTADGVNPEILQPSDVLMIAKDPPYGAVGLSPLWPLALTLMIEHAAQRYQLSNLRNSVRPPGGVTLPDTELAKDPEFRRMFESELMSLNGGYENAGKPILLPPGSDWKNFAYSASEAELINQRKLNREEVAAAYDISPPLIGIMDRATYSNIVELVRGLFQTTMPPWLTLIQDAIYAQVIAAEPAFAGQWVEFDLTDVLRGDPVKEAAALKQGLQGGGMTLNEVRQVRNQPPIDHPNADVPLVQANNLLPITELGDDATDSGNAYSEDEEPALKALFENVRRAGDRVYRRMKAGEPDPWAAERFERELRDDLAAAGMNGEASPTAKAWTAALDAIVADAAGDPDTLRTSFKALERSTPQN